MRNEELQADLGQGKHTNPPHCCRHRFQHQEGQANSSAFLGNDELGQGEGYFNNFHSVDSSLTREAKTNTFTGKQLCASTQTEPIEFVDLNPDLINNNNQVSTSVQASETYHSRNERHWRRKALHSFHAFLIFIIIVNYYNFIATFCNTAWTEGFFKTISRFILPTQKSVKIEKEDSFYEYYSRRIYEIFKVLLRL